MQSTLRHSSSSSKKRPDATPTITLEVVSPPSKRLKPNPHHKPATHEGQGIYLTLLQNMPCTEDSIAIARLVSPGGKEGYYKPLVDFLKSNPDAALDRFCLMAILSRRDPTNGEGLIPQTPESVYPSRCMVFVKDEATSTEEFLTKFSSEFTDWANEKTNTSYIGTHNLFRVAPSETPPMPVHHYLRIKDTLLLLKKIYGTVEEVTKADIEADETLLENFFGTSKLGQEILHPLSEVQWQNLNL